jgi:hypothetical protein
VIKEVTMNTPPRSVDRVFLMEESKLLDNFRKFFITAVNQILRQEGEQLLFYICKFPSLQVLQVELFSQSEDLPLYRILFIAVFVIDGEFISPGKNTLFDIKIHLVSPLCRTLPDCMDFRYSFDDRKHDLFHDR